jgi:hypothetical protein
MPGPGPNPGDARTPAASTLAGLSIASALYYVAAILVLHVGQPDLHPVDRFMSEYVLGRWGPLMTTTFFAWAFGLVCITVALRRVGLPGKMGTAGLVLTWIGALGITIAGAFPMDPVGEPFTRAGVLHTLGGLVGLPFTALGLLFLSLAFRSDERWRPVAGVGAALAGAFLLGFLVIGFVFDGGPGSGAAQRVAIGSGLAWMMVVGWRVRKVAGDRPGLSPPARRTPSGAQSPG